MGNIPLPALSIRPPEQIDPLQGVKNLYALKAMAGQQQLQQQQIQASQQENQQRQLQLNDQQTLRGIFKDPNIDFTSPDAMDSVIKKAASSGVSPQTLFQLRNSQVEFQKNLAGLSKDQIANQQALNDQRRGALTSIIQAKDPAQKQALWQQEVQNEIQNGTAKQGQLPDQYPGDDNATVLANHLALGSTLTKEATERMQAEARASQAKTSAAELQARLPGGPLNAVTQHVQEETDPRVVAVKNQLAKSEAAARQAVADGDPNAAAQLLISGAVSPSQIISARKPEFAQKAFSAAAQLNPQWNAQKAEGDFQVAKSPANVAFFGSAKSLTDKGGTLDQLAAAAKDIPGNQVPVFNTIADAAKAATGDGPVAKYASILLGVSDDYSKVMGGGQGSDASRSQALKLIPANASPEARAAAIEGIRGSVASQMNGRIGKNGVLQRMYGEQGGQQQSGGLSVTDPRGVTHTFPDQKSADAYRQAAGIK